MWSVGTTRCGSGWDGLCVRRCRSRSAGRCMMLVWRCSFIGTIGRSSENSRLSHYPIELIAMAHGGVYNGSADKISKLPLQQTVNGQKIRPMLLAALLRFGDEIADDAHRASKSGEKYGVISENSRIYHAYSHALHSVNIERNSQNNKLELILTFSIDTKTLLTDFKKDSEVRCIIDEIHDRTLKMERERRYCMRFLRSYIFVESIRVEITITNSNDSWQFSTKNYTLEEKGYPTEPNSGKIKDFEPRILTGEEERIEAKKEWGIVDAK
jgi:hypothetical protein